MTSAMQRPGYRTKSILDCAAHELANGMPEIPGGPESLVAAIADALAQEAPLFDAYRITRALEDNHGWACDRDTVSTFDDAGHVVARLVLEATANWVARCAIKPRLKVGDPVKIDTKGSRALKGPCDGEIIAIDEQHATYTVMVPVLGHVRTGCGTHGLIVPYEQLHELAAPADEFTLTAP